MTNDITPNPSPDPTPAKAAAGTRMWVRVLLFGSLALNLVIVGLVAGAILRGGPGGDGNPRLRDAGLGPLGNVLSGEQRTALRGALREHSGPLGNSRAAMRENIVALLAAMRAETFDRDQMQSLLDEQRQLLGDRQAIGHTVLLDALAQATPEQRGQMANRLEKALKRGRRNSGDQRGRN